MFTFPIRLAFAPEPLGLAYNCSVCFTVSPSTLGSHAMRRLFLVIAILLPVSAQNSSFEAGLTLYRNGKLPEALERFKESEQASEVSPLRQFYRGVCLAKLGQWGPASASLSNYLESYPADPHGWFWLSRVQLLQKDYSGAHVSIQRAIAIGPASSETKRVLGEIELELGQNQLAYEAWIEAHRLDPLDAQTTYHLGRLFFEAEFFKEAADWLRDTLRLVPAHFSALTYLALCAEHLGDEPTAIRLYKQAIAQSKSQKAPFAWAYVSYAKLLRQSGNDKEALFVLEESARLAPDASALAILGQILQDRGERDRAERAYRRGIQLDPNVSVLHYRLSLLLRSGGRVEEAQRESDLFSRAKKAEEAARTAVSAIRKE